MGKARSGFWPALKPLMATWILLLNCVPYIQKAAKENLIRVAVLSNVDNAFIGGIRNKIYHDAYQVSLNDTFPLYFESKDGHTMVNGKVYRGQLVVRKTGNKFWVINILGIEDYLKGVVPCEIGSITTGLVEAARAQAVAARTYTWAHRNQYEELGFDLYSTIKDQVYGGMDSEDEIINQAIEQTHGRILAYQGKPAEAKYHSTCGGRTADFNDAWKGVGPPYLHSVECPYCTNSPYYQWRKASSKRDFFANIRGQLAKLGATIADTELIKDFRFKRNKKSKRVVQTVVTTTVKEYYFDPNSIRTLFGDRNDPGGLLRSSYFELKATEDSIIIEGKGFGHGVGMCQFGALEMARKGKNYKQILQHYYPGTRIIP